MTTDNRVLNLNDPMTIVRMVAKAGPPVRYNEGDDLEDDREDGTYDCMYCGPNSLTVNEAYDERAHGERCPWRLAKELVAKTA